VRELRKFVKESVSDVRDLIAGKYSNAAAVRQELARHIDEIILLPVGERGVVRYKGKWDLIGSTDGAEGPTRTERPGLISSSRWRHEPDIRHFAVQDSPVASL
jgi:hypothetical protein